MRLPRFVMSAIVLPLAASLGACGGGGDGNSLAPGPSTYDIAAGVSGLVTHGMKANLAVSGSLTVNGVLLPLTGTGTLTLDPATAGTFNGAAVQTQAVSINVTVVAGGQSASTSSTVLDHYDATTYALLGETSPGEYDVASAPIAFPAMVMAGSNGTLGTLSRYADSNQGVALGTVQISYLVKAPVNASAPAVALQLEGAEGRLRGISPLLGVRGRGGVLPAAGRGSGRAVASRQHLSVGTDRDAAGPVPDRVRAGKPADGSEGHAGLVISCCSRSQM